MIDALISNYLLALRIEGKSPATIAYHGRGLALLERWMADHWLVHPDELTKERMREYILFLQSRTKRDGSPMSVETIRTEIGSARTFINWLRREDLTTADPFRHIKIPKAPRYVKEVFTEEELRILLAHLPKRRHRRDEALVLFALDTACRSSEILGIRRSDVDIANGLAVVMGKGSIQRRVAFSPSTSRALLKYDRSERNQECEHLFQNRSGGQLSMAGLRMLCDRLTLALGFHVNPHKFRHTAATMYASGGASAHQIQQLLGHADIGISVRYVHLNTGALIEANRKHSVVERAKRR